MEVEPKCAGINSMMVIIFCYPVKNKPHETQASKVAANIQH